ncbi:MAG: hypothetical protein EP329_27740, partial [Deltaproteobacteria bacterium]
MMRRASLAAILALVASCGDSGTPADDTLGADVVHVACPTTCADQDGNPCTVPTCDDTTGTCVEIAAANGVAVASGCYDGVVCHAGSPDTSGATLTALGQSCQAADAALDPFGCKRIRCVEGYNDCVDVLKPAGAACWLEGVDGDGATCPAHACDAGGSCVAAADKDVTCAEADYPAGCDVECQACTTLACHWIPDPSAPDAPAKKVRYCEPQAVADGACDDGNACSTGDVCRLDQVGSGPLGKETTGICEASGGKSKEDCLTELSLPALPCLRAGMGCDADGCALDQELANAWCRPPAPVCVNTAETYCTHVDVGDGKWNASTGCHLVVYAATCDDGDPCSVDSCGASGCEHTPLPDETPCGAGATCQAGHCVQTCSPPVDGGWSGWSCAPCTAECGGGLRTCTRTCTAPAPSCGGADCEGASSFSEDCNTAACGTDLPVGTTTYSDP